MTPLNFATPLKKKKMIRRFAARRAPTLASFSGLAGRGPLDSIERAYEKNWAQMQDNVLLKNLRIVETPPTPFSSSPPHPPSSSSSDLTLLLARHGLEPDPDFIKSLISWKGSK